MHPPDSVSYPAKYTLVKQNVPWKVAYSCIVYVGGAAEEWGRGPCFFGEKNQVNSVGCNSDDASPFAMLT